MKGIDERKDEWSASRVGSVPEGSEMESVGGGVYEEAEEDELEEPSKATELSDTDSRVDGVESECSYEVGGAGPGGGGTGA